jgi:hypothetical protein
MAATKAKPPVKSKQSAKKPARPVKRTSPGSLSIVSPPEAAPRGARLHVWHVVPGLSTGIASYEGPLETGAVVVWQIFEDRNIVNWSDVCQGDPRFIRRRAVLTDPQQSFDLAWGDGSPAGFRISASKPNAEQAEVRIQKIEPVLPPTADRSTTVVKARKIAKARLKRASR